MDMKAAEKMQSLRQCKCLVGSTLPLKEVRAQRDLKKARDKTFILVFSEQT